GHDRSDGQVGIRSSQRIAPNAPPGAIDTQEKPRTGNKRREDLADTARRESEQVLARHPGAALAPRFAADEPTLKRVEALIDCAGVEEEGSLRHAPPAVAAGHRTFEQRL